MKINECAIIIKIKICNVLSTFPGKTVQMRVDAMDA